MAEKVAKIAQIGPIWGREEMKSEFQTMRNIYRWQELKLSISNRVRNAIK